MLVTEAEEICNKYHEKAFSWLLLHIFNSLNITESVEEFFDHIDEKKLKRFILAISTQDPGTFAEFHFRNRPEFALTPGNKNEPWRWFPDQWDTINYTGNFILSSGTGAGKTRLLACLGLYAVALKHASVLVVTHSETARDQIFDEMFYQIYRSPFLQRYFPLNLVYRGAVKEIGCADGYSSIKFCLSGDGKMVMGIQIGRGGYILCDEAANYRDKAWKPIMSRGRDGSTIVVTSVPYGEPGNKFDELYAEAQPMDLASFSRLSDEEKSKVIDFACKRWSKEDQPTWSERQKLIAIRDYGDEDSAGYATYVKGFPARGGDLVFSQDQIKAVFQNLNLYKRVTLVWHDNKKYVTVSVATPNSSHTRLDKRSEDRILIGTENSDYSTIFSAILSKLPVVPVDLMGLDAGKLQDTCVILGGMDTGEGLQEAWSINMLNVPYVIQAQLIIALKTELKVNLGLGIEASGYNTGTVIWEALRYSSNGSVPPIWLSPFNWSVNWEVREADNAGSAVKIDLKHHLTRQLVTQCELQAQNRDKRYLVLPRADSILYDEMSCHAYTYRANDKVLYGKKKDHNIEALRAMYGRYLLVKGNRQMIQAANMSTERITISREERRDNRQ